MDSEVLGSKLRADCTTNLLAETETALKNHHLTWNSVKFIKARGGLVSVADFVAIAKNINYNSSYGVVEVDPSLKIVGGSWWLERFNYDGREGWIFLKKPARPTLNAIDCDFYSSYGYCDGIDWEERIEQ